MFDVHLYLSGNVTKDVDFYILSRPNVYRLTSYAYRKETEEFLQKADLAGVRCNLIVDSGAFTSWSVGKPVVLKDLIRFNDDIIKRFAARHNIMMIALDVIPGERGRRATADEIHKAVDTSYANTVQMHQHFAGHRVLPVFHSGEDFRLRDAYLAFTDYICLSMNQDMSEHERVEWAKRAAAPGFRYHGLAATGNRMVTEVPWFSVDSSSWVTVGAMGGVLWPTPTGLRVLPISSTSPSRFDAGKHFMTISPAERAAVERRMADNGFAAEQLADNPHARMAWNVLMWETSPWRRNVQPPVDLFS